MTHRHRITGEVLTCLYCRVQGIMEPCTQWIRGLWPVCDEHGQEYLDAPGETRQEKMDYVYAGAKSKLGPGHIPHPVV